MTSDARDADQEEAPGPEIKKRDDALFALIGLLLVPLAVVWGGWCLLLMWRWFAPSAFGSIGYAQACGIDVAIAMLRIPPPIVKEIEVWTTARKLRRIVETNFLLPAFSLLVGLLVHLIGGR